MSRLTPNLFDRRFSDLLEMGRARIHSLAPDWTDHNAHDPGITLTELLAWVAEAQFYALSRLRRDERHAYAALLGLSPSGTQAARGAIWPDRQDPNSAVTTFAKNLVIPEDSGISLVGTDTPTFRPQAKLLWIPGRITSLIARGSGGAAIDLTKANQRGDVPFLPFGERASEKDVLALTFECRDDAGLLAGDPEKTAGALWTIGVQAAPLEINPDGANESDFPPDTQLSAALRTDGGRFPLAIAQDSTRGLLTTGVIFLDLSGVTTSPRQFTIELRAACGFARPPRVLRMEPNVIPIQQGRTIDRELHVANGLPDWSFTLNVPGLRFAMGEEPLVLEVAEFSGLNTWSRCDRLSDAGPTNRVFELDLDKGEITFGNGVNGSVPARDSQVLVTYSVSDGQDGAVARNRKWRVTGIGGVAGLNPDPVTGCLAAPGFTEERREARRRTREDCVLVTPTDLAAAALKLPLLEVARAWVASPGPAAPRSGEVRLIAMRARPGGIEPEEPPETSRWLDAIRRSLAPRLLLGSRLAVLAPAYIEFSIEASVEAAPAREPDAVRKDIQKSLATRLALVETLHVPRPRKPGGEVTARDVVAWIRGTPGVTRVARLQLRNSRGSKIDTVDVPRNGLPRWNARTSRIEVTRPQKGGRP